MRKGKGGREGKGRRDEKERERGREGKGEGRQGRGKGKVWEERGGEICLPIGESESASGEMGRRGKGQAGSLGWGVQALFFGLNLIMHQTIGLTGYMRHLTVTLTRRATTLTLDRSSFSPTLY